MRPIAVPAAAIVAAAAFCLAPSAATANGNGASAQDPGGLAAGLPDGRAVLERAIEAMGGREAFDAVKSSAMELSLKSDVGTLEIRTLAMQPDKISVELMASIERPMQIRMARNGAASWMEIQALTPELTPVGPEQIIPSMPPAQRAQLAQFGDAARAHWVVLRLLEDYQTVETVGVEPFEGTPSIKVRAADPRTDRAKADVKGDRFIYLSLSDGYPLGVDAPGATPAAAGTPPTRQRLIFSNVSTFGRLKLFTKMELDAGRIRQSFTWNSIVFNSIPAVAFTVPAEARPAEQPAAPVAPAGTGSTGG